MGYILCTLMSFFSKEKEHNIAWLILVADYDDNFHHYLWVDRPIVASSTGSTALVFLSWADQ